MLKSKTKFFLIGLITLLWQGLACAGEIPQNSILGFGTQKIDSKNSFMIQEAINMGYRLFDTADLYQNIDIIAPILKQNNLENLHIVYKITPPNTLEEVEIIKNKIDKVIEILGSIDCLMFHSIDSFYKNHDSEMVESFLDYVRALISESKVKSFGISNINSQHKEIMEYFKRNNLKIDVIENHFNNNTVNYYPTKDIVSYAQKNDIKFIGYGALGGIVSEGPCEAFCEVRQPLIHFDSITHPFVTTLSKRYDVDPMMLMLAYESKKFNVYQIPTTTSSKRLQNNFASFSKAYDLLTEEDLNAITNEIGFAQLHEFQDIPSHLRNITQYRSRLSLIRSLISTNSEVIKTIDNLKNVFKDNNVDYDNVINKFLYIYEQAEKFNKEIELENLLRELNSLMNAEHQERFRPVFIELFNFNNNQHYMLLIDVLIKNLKDYLPRLKLLEKNHFDFYDYSDLKKIWPARRVLVVDPKEHKIIRFDLGPQTNTTMLLDLLKRYGVKSHVLVDYNNDKYDLNTIDKNFDVTSLTDGFIPMINNTFIINNSNETWNDILVFDPFTYQSMYRY